MVYTDYFSGVSANFLRSSVAQAGYDPDNLPSKGDEGENFGSESMAKTKVWRDIWSAGQGIGNIREVAAVAQIVTEMRDQYRQAAQHLSSAAHA
ncbi:hypothetical protein D3C79_860990 [compost metagenome]